MLGMEGKQWTMGFLTPKVPCWLRYRRWQLPRAGGHSWEQHS